MRTVTPERRWTQPVRRRAVASPLRCPDTPLGRARRARGWSQHKAVRALRIAADQRGLDIAQEDSLKVMLSRWEHGHARPGPAYRELFTVIYRATPDALGFAPVGGDYDRLRRRVRQLEALVGALVAELPAEGGEFA